MRAKKVFRLDFFNNIRNVFTESASRRVLEENIPLESCNASVVI